MNELKKLQNLWGAVEKKDKKTIAKKIVKDLVDKEEIFTKLLKFDQNPLSCKNQEFLCIQWREKIDGRFGGFKQRKTEKRNVMKWQKWYLIMYPKMQKEKEKEKESCYWVWFVYVREKSQTEITK